MNFASGPWPSPMRRASTSTYVYSDQRLPRLNPEMTEVDHPTPYHFRPSCSRAVHGSTSIIHRQKPGQDWEDRWSPLEPTGASGLVNPPPAGATSSQLVDRIPFFSSLLFPTNARRCYRASRLVLTQRANWFPARLLEVLCAPCPVPAASVPPPRSTLPTAQRTQPLHCPSLATIPASSPVPAPR